MKSIFVLLVCAFQVSMIGCLTVPYQFYCGGDETCSALDPIQGTLKLNECYLNCNPCFPDQCSYQSFMLLNNQVFQNQWADSQCSIPRGSEVYPCETCFSPFNNASGSISCSLVHRNLAVGSSTFNGFCNSTSCAATAVAVPNVEYTKCIFLCNPCNPTQCTAQSFQSFTPGVVVQNIYQNATCMGLGQTNTYVCDTCFSGGNLDSYKTVCDSQTLPAHPLTYNYYCGASACGVTPHQGTTALDECLFMCNPCVATQCSFQQFHQETNGTITQSFYDDSACKMLSDQQNHPCGECFIGGIDSFSFQCSSAQTSSSAAATGSSSAATGSSSAGTSSSSASTSSSSAGTSSSSSTGVQNNSTTTLHISSATTFGYSIVIVAVACLISSL